MKALIGKVKEAPTALVCKLPEPVRRKLHKASSHGEHWGFVAVAAVDAFHFHSFLFIVSIWLLVTGLAMELFGKGLE